MEFLLSRLANDMRQTLHQIVGLIELTAEEPLSPAQSQNLSRCRASADQLLRTAADVSEMASAQPLPASNGVFHLTRAIDEVIDIMRVLAGRKHLELSKFVSSNVPDGIVGDKDAMQDILRRLLDNSIRCTDQGGIRLAVTSTVRDANSAVLTFEIADTGSGMPAEVLARHRQPLGGPLDAGLSLLLVRRRLSALGGQFAIVDSTCDGTTVRITLPVSLVGNQGLGYVQQPADDGTSPNEAPLEVTPLQLLVVEDSDESFALFQAYVKGQGHSISRAHNGALGVEMVKSGDFDLVVMDVHMPVMDGYAATRKIREWETGSGRTRLPILLFSSDGVSQMRRGAPVGCSGFIAKPARKQEVLKALNYFGRRER